MKLFMTSWNDFRQGCSQVFPVIDEVMVKPLRVAKDRYEEMKSKEDAAKEP
jgi:hypothetical protein